MKNREKYFCIFGGGAIRGLVYIGAVRALKEKNVEIVGYAGASAGSISAVMSALDYSSDEMYEVFNNFDYRLFRDVNISLKIELAFSKGEVFTDKIRELIAKKLNTDKPVLFKDFPKDLYILAANITTGKSIVFSKETTPDFEVAQAVRISTGFPGLMNPVEIDGEYYVDGDLARACALSQISPLLNPKDYRILEFRLEGSKNQDLPKNPFSFLNNGLDFVNNIATDNVLKTFADKDKYDYIVITTENILLFDFNISQEQRDYMVNLGYETTLGFFDKKLPQKRKLLAQKYNVLKQVVDKIFSSLCTGKCSNAKQIISDYLCENYNDLKVFDENVTQLFIELYKDIIKLKKVLFVTPNISNAKKSLTSLSLELDKKLN